MTFKEVPAGHTATCINDCQSLWSVGPYATGTPGNNPADSPLPAYSQKYGGVPVWVTDISDPKNPYTYPTPVDTKRFDGQTGYVHSVDVDRNGVAWTSGAGGVRGYYTIGTHYDPVQKKTRLATAFDPIPYAGGTTPLVKADAGRLLRVLRPQREPHHPEGRQLPLGRPALRDQREHHHLLAGG